MFHDTQRPVTKHVWPFDVACQIIATQRGCDVSVVKREVRDIMFPPNGKTSQMEPFGTNPMPQPLPKYRDKRNMRELVLDLMTMAPDTVFTARKLAGGMKANLASIRPALKHLVDRGEITRLRRGEFVYRQQGDAEPKVPGQGA